QACERCYVSKNYDEFLNEKGVSLKKYLICQNKLKTKCLKNKVSLEPTISHTDIIETVYNFLISLNNTNDFYEEENKELYINFNIELLSFQDFLLEQKETNKENLNFEFELEKRQAKYPDLDKQRDTSTFLERYHCEETIKIEIFSKLDLIVVKYSYKMLYPRPSHIETSSKIKQFIKDNINCFFFEICYQVCETQINKYESITIQQIYYWCLVES
ncbi:3705_t:CDS:2, partial [Racocetra persica]